MSITLQLERNIMQIKNIAISAAIIAALAFAGCAKKEEAPVEAPAAEAAASEAHAHLDHRVLRSAVSDPGQAAA